MADQEFSLTTKIRFLINKLLSPAGIYVSTNVKEEKEKEHLITLKNKGHWKEQKYLKGLNLKDGDYIKFIDEICIPFQGDFRKFPKEFVEKNSNNYYLNNEFFSNVDAEVLYSVIRHYKPQHVIEVGSGFSTRLMRLAIGDGNLSTKIVCIDPQPRVDILEHADEHFAFKVEDLPIGSIFGKMNPGDILFIDSSHIVSTGSDVNFLFLEILPDLPPGVLIQIHDVYFPFDYPEEWVVNEHWGWNEQYLVQAFLMFNDSFEIIWPSNYMMTSHYHKLRRSFLPFENNYKPSSLWIKKLK